MRILVAEDFDDTRLMMRLLLEMNGHSVLEAADGREAVLVAEREHPDLVLMDLNMPVLDGIEATRLLHESPSTASVPVVAVTAHCADSVATVPANTQKDDRRLEVPPLEGGLVMLQEYGSQ